MRCLVLDGPHVGRRDVSADWIHDGRVLLRLPCPPDWSEADYECRPLPAQSYNVRPATDDESLRFAVDLVAFT